MHWFHSIDWDATGSMLQGIGTFAGVGAVVFAANVGANAWRRQKLAERRLEVAERILTATHKARSALSFIRGVLMSASELDKAAEQLRENPHYLQMLDEKKRRARQAQAYINRIVACRSEIDALEECLPLARAWFDEKLEEELTRLRQQFHIVQVMHDAYVDDWNEQDAEFTKKIRRAIYDVDPGDGTPNEVPVSVVNAVKAIETTVQPALRLSPSIT